MYEKSNRWWDWGIGICLFVCVFISAQGLEATNWTDDLDKVTLISVYGILLGFLIGFSTFKKKIALCILWIYFLLLFLLVFIIRLNDDPSWMNRMIIFFSRISVSSNQLINNIPLDDGILFLTSMAMLFGIVTINLGYQFVRTRNIWLWLLILSTSFFTVQIYRRPSQRDFISIFIFTVLIFIILGRLYFINRRSECLRMRIKEDYDTFSMISYPYVIAVVIIVFISLALPFLHEKILFIDRFRNIDIGGEDKKTWDLLENFFNPLSQPEEFRITTIPSELPLGLKRDLSVQPVFEVLVPEEHLDKRYYWQGRVYRVYDSGEWKNDFSDWFEGDEFDFMTYSGDNDSFGPYQFTYRLSHKIVLTPQIIDSVSKKVKVQYFNQNQAKDIISIEGERTIRPAEKITVVGQFNWPPLNKLLLSNGETPDWIEDIYLRLPRDYSQRITDLAISLTADKTTRYEKVDAITYFLRSEYKYRDSVSIPNGIDPVEWFLFEGKRGFCNYFASAQVLMLRSIGIPARIVVGYSQGYKKPGENIFVARVNDSHSWVEVFFPDIGWVIFEPTPYLPAIHYENDIPLDELSVELSQEEQLNDWQTEMGDERENFRRDSDRSTDQDNIFDVENQQVAIFRPVFWVGLLTALIIFGIYYLVFLKEQAIKTPILIEEMLKKQSSTVPGWIRNWADYENKNLIERYYLNIKYFSGILLGFENKKNKTPGQYLENVLEEILLKDAKKEWFINQYLRQVYGGQKHQEIKATKAIYREIILLIFKKSLRERFQRKIA